MPRPTGPTNAETIKLLNELERAGRVHGARIWLAVAEKIRRPRRKRVEVNVWKINKLTREGDVVVVPGKVLGDGVIRKAVTVAALSFSKRAEEKIRAAGGRVLSIGELIGERPRGSGVKIVC
ncbi:MAG: 50S ribosomal protein L18e [Thermoproteota archaeon]|nr:MAG: 50S ribosomal protein L18e [Candidatus Korarchaeota archaeon]